MTDHLPECLMLDERYPKHPLENCDYCNMLRACEQRVLDAAREAVLSVEPWNLQALLLKSEQVIAAIDALRGEA